MKFYKNTLTAEHCHAFPLLLAFKHDRPAPLWPCRQDALSYSTEKITGEREIGGQPYYDVQIISPDVSYLACVTFNQGKVYALFVKSPSKSFKADEEVLRHVVDTFHTI